MSRKILIIGAGVVGLCTAYYCARRGFAVTVIERSGAQRDGCSFGNAGMIVPSHFMPLAAPGMVALGLKWMWNPASPFYIQPRSGHGTFQLGREILARGDGGTRPPFRAVDPRFALASRACFEELAALPGSGFRPGEKRSAHALPDRTRAGGGNENRWNRLAHSAFLRRCSMRNRPPRLIPARGWTSPARFIFRRTAISRRNAVHGGAANAVRTVGREISLGERSRELEN